MSSTLQNHLATRKQGVSAGIYAVCSAHSRVIRAAAMGECQALVTFHMRRQPNAPVGVIASRFKAGHAASYIGSSSLEDAHQAMITAEGSVLQASESSTMGPAVRVDVRRPARG